MKSIVPALALLMFASACPTPTTSVRLQLQYDESWPLVAFVVSAREKMVRLNSSSSDGTKTREVVVSVANDWAGDPIVYTVRAYIGAPGQEQLYASGHATVTAVEGESVEALVVLSPTACAAWCTPGATVCRNGGVSICEMSGTGCPRWGAPAVCPTGQSCSLGECAAQCVNECAEGDTRCAGPLGVEACGQSDSDPCLDWQQPILCEGAELCSNGRCSAECTSECAIGTVRCRDGGVSTCVDVNGDGCAEWGPMDACDPGQSCSGTVGEPNAAGAAHCEARSACTDECTGNACSGSMLVTCGNFDLDPCREPSSGTNCTGTTDCSEGVCDMAAAGGAGGCVVRARNTPECAASCAGQADNVSCDDGNACTVMDHCTSGVCGGAAMDCTLGRAPTCEGGVARTYATAGRCMNGTCQHSVQSEVTCTNGCDGNDCAADSNCMRPVDVLFLIDNSGSMAQEQAQLARELPALVRAMASGDVDGDGRADFAGIPSLHFGVVTSDLGTPRSSLCERVGDDGRMQTVSYAASSNGELGPRTDCAGFASGQRFLTFDRGSDTSAFATTAACPIQAGNGGCGIEMQLEATLKALTPASSPLVFDSVGGRSPTGHGDGANAGFLRNDSLLVLAFVTDEEDCSTVPSVDPDFFLSDGGRFVAHPINRRCGALQADSTLIHPVQRYVDGFLRLRSNPRQLLVTAIAGVPPTLLSGANRLNYQAILDDPLMRHAADPTMPNFAQPSCTWLDGSSATATAFPPRRIVETLRGIENAGGNVALQSICQPTWSARFLVEAIADSVSRSCSQ